MRKHTFFLSSAFPFIGNNGTPLRPQNVKTSVQNISSYHHNANGRFGIISETAIRANQIPKQNVTDSKTVRFAFQNGAFCNVKWCVLQCKMVRFAKRYSDSLKRQEQRRRLKMRIDGVLEVLISHGIVVPFQK